MRLLSRIGLCISFLGMMFTGIACVVPDWQMGSGGYKVGGRCSGQLLLLVLLNAVPKWSPRQAWRCVHVQCCVW